MLRAGADDLGGTLIGKTISGMVGSEHGSAKTVVELVEICASIGRRVVLSATIYQRKPVFFGGEVLWPGRSHRDWISESAGKNWSL